MILPTIHLNGTSRETLSREYQNAWRAARKAREVLVESTCHARDYYVHPHDSAFSEARQDRDNQLQKLDEVIEYLEAHVMHLM